MSTPHNFKPGPEQPDRGVRCIEGLSREHGGVSCGRPEDAPIHRGISDKYAAMIPDPHPLENCGPLRFALSKACSCPTCGTVVAAPEETPEQALLNAVDRLAPIKQDEWLNRATDAVGVPLWQHLCGAVEAFPPVEAFKSVPFHGGCDHCNSGHPKPDDWRAPYTRRGDA